ncbi:receptor-type tyrosine-protein phosphatase O-like, partial [Oncorhynchus tshawytscha]|uniref:receptor-type tyrosine-protein phosphatase O-like n=1 Tax=Oncorhynchus tshawytscha TaxID=74940 RepID=UPI001C3C9041
MMRRPVIDVSTVNQQKAVSGLMRRPVIDVSTVNQQKAVSGLMRRPVIDVSTVNQQKAVSGLMRRTVIDVSTVNQQKAVSGLMRRPVIDVSTVNQQKAVSGLMRRTVIDVSTVNQQKAVIDQRVKDRSEPFRRRSLFAFLTLLPSCLWTDYLLAFYINPWSKTALKKRKLTSPVQMDDFDAYLKDMSKDSAYKFSLQFEVLKSVGLDLSHDAADLPINRPKNRYTNILPYDFSRVKVIYLHNDEGSDYINANYIPGYKSPREYIATQGPLPETRNDFWNMILQQKSHIIVMLTQCNERRRVKCDHYWPFTDEPVTYGEISVEMLSESESPEWTIRNFRLGY